MAPWWGAQFCIRAPGKIRPDGHQAILFRFAHNLAGAAGHGSPAQRGPGSAVRIFPGATKYDKTKAHRFGFGILCAGLEEVRQLF